MFAVRLIYFLACVLNTVAMMSACLMLVFVVLLPAATYVGRYHIMVIIILGAAMLGEYHQSACSYTHRRATEVQKTFPLPNRQAALWNRNRNRRNRNFLTSGTGTGTGTVTC